jgi:plastocyanin
MNAARAFISATAFAAVTVALLATAAAESVRVTIKDLEFLPATITVKVGDVIEWSNTDFIAHTATARSGAWNVQIEAGATATFTVTQAGTIVYFCKYHPNMTATLVVTAN